MHNLRTDEAFRYGDNLLDTTVPRSRPDELDDETSTIEERDGRRAARTSWRHTDLLGYKQFRHGKKEKNEDATPGRRKKLAQKAEDPT